MRTLTIDTVYGESGRELNMYVEGQLAMISVNAEIKNIVSNINMFHTTSGEREVAITLVKEINEEFELTDEETEQFKEQIEIKLREGEL